MATKNVISQEANARESMKTRILVISSTPWSYDNSFGNSFSNIFEGMENLEFCNIYCLYGLPKNNIAGKYFQITEKSLVRNFLNRKHPSGREVNLGSETEELNQNEQKLFDHTRKIRLQIFFWARDLVWGLGRWRSKELYTFISNFKPHLIYQPLYYSTYINNIVLYAKKTANAPMVCYVSDDVFTLRQFSLSPLYWIDRFVKRRIIRKVVNESEHLYVISQVQKKDYEECFKKECKILTKGANFINPAFKTTPNNPLKLVYTGNVGSGRWQMLALVGKVLKSLNADSVKAQLFVYSTTPLTNKMQKALNDGYCSFFMGGVPNEQVASIQSDADVLIHVEPTNLQGRLLVRHSFSTKIVDYFHSARCILAIGWPKAASIDHLVQNDAALVAHNEASVYEQLSKIITKPEIVQQYARNAWECGKRHHQLNQIQTRLKHDIEQLLKKKGAKS